MIKVAGDLRAPTIISAGCGHSEIARYLFTANRPIFIG